MNKKELIRALAARQKCTRAQAKGFLEAFMGILTERIASEDDVELLKFGAFRPWHQTPRMARNPRNGDPYYLESRLSVKFKPSVYLIRKINVPDTSAGQE